MSEPERSPRKEHHLGRWGLAVFTAWAVVVAANAGWVRYAQHLRDQDHRAYLAEAAELAEHGRYVDALEAIETAKELAPGEGAVYAQEGNIYFRLNQWQKAVTAFQSALDKGYKERGPEADIVWALVKLERYDEAVEAAQRAMDNGAARVKLHRYLAEAFMRMGRESDAIPHFEAALDNAPSDLYLLGRLAAACRRAGAQQQAESIQERIDEIQTALER